MERPIHHGDTESTENARGGSIDQLLNKAPNTKDIYPKIPLAPGRW